MSIANSPLAPAKTNEIPPRRAEELLYEALDVMQLLDAGVPVTLSWVMKRDALVEEARRLFENNNQSIAEEKEE